MPWASGVFLRSANPSSVTQFENWRGRQVDFVTMWTHRGNWAEIADPTPQVRMWQGQGRRLVIGQGMLPNDGSGTLAACANGAYNHHWRAWADALKRHGLDDSVVRLGWEFNGDWEPWSAYNPDQFAGCWRQVVSTAEQVAPSLVWDWNVNRGVTGGLADPRLAWPGDSYVDIVGVDTYDWWMAATSLQVFQTYHSGTSNQAMGYWADFARQHGKRLSIPEWGNRSGGGTAGGDNPLYVELMRGFFDANADLISYESNFQAEGGEYNNGASLPNAAAAYKRFFGSG